MDVAELDSLRIVLDPIGQIGVAVALMLVMFSVALGLRVDDFRFLLERPQLFIGGVVAQVVLLPAVTYFLILVMQPAPSIALGMIVVACCPGGAVSNLLTYLSRGNLAISVALTATSSMLAALFTPASILFWSHSYGPTSTLLKSLDVSPYVFLAQTTFLLGVPLVCGMIVAAKAPDVAKRIRKRATLLGAGTLIGVIIYGIAYFYPVLISALPLLSLFVVIHNAVAFITGAAAGRLLSPHTATRRAITFEIGIQNAGLALVILIGQLKGLGGAAAIAAVWGVWDLIAGGAIAVFFRFVDSRKTSDYDAETAT
jgi:BASS family bile acid:Na+ symporter